jgi:chitin deacetylase
MDKGSKPFRRTISIATALTIGLVLCAFGLYKIRRSRTYQSFGEILPRVDTDAKAVALTFDDGPTPAATDQVLGVLARYNVKASFFLVGNEIERHLDEAVRISQAGHEIGNHTYGHQPMIMKPMSFYKEEIARTDVLIRKTGYHGPIYFRAPGCLKLLGLPYYLQETHRKHITFDVEPDSFSEIARNSDRIVQYVLANTHAGSIILLHVMYASRRTSMDAIPGIIEGLRARGYEFKTVSELIALGNRGREQSKVGHVSRSCDPQSTEAELTPGLQSSAIRIGTATNAPFRRIEDGLLHLIRRPQTGRVASLITLNSDKSRR